MSYKNRPCSDYTLRHASWPKDNAALRSIRTAVFIEEQHVPEALEWDDEDEAALHLLALDREGNPIGTARMLADGHIGRVAVLKGQRHCGVGSALMQMLLEEARVEGHTRVVLDAQVEALPFYQRLGFSTEGEVFMDAGIPHRHMWLELDT